MKPSMAEMVFADAVKREERHAEFRIKLYQRAADLHNAYVQDCIDKRVVLDPEFDPGALWNAAMGAARQELQPAFTLLPPPETLIPGLQGWLPDYRRPA